MDSVKIIKYADLSNGETYAYRDAGTSKDIIVFVHGNLSSSYYFEAILPKYIDKYRVIAPDLRGYGHSSCKNAPKSIEDLVEDLRLLMDYLEIKMCVLMGWCMGGGIAMKFAAMHADYIIKMIIFHSINLQGLPAYLVDQNGNSTNKRAKDMGEILTIPKNIELDKALQDQDRSKIESVLNEIYFSNSKKPSREQLDAYISETMLQKSYSVAAHIMNQYNISKENNKVTDGTGEMDKITCQILVMGGSNDKVCSVYDQLHLGKALKDIAQVKIFENCSRFCIGDYPNEIADITKWFIDSE